jgi:hypothetical protein
MITGSCVCGRFAFEVDPPLQLMTHCHCTYCRKSHGVAFATYVGVPPANFRWTKGAGEQQRYASSPGLTRPFCPTCGSKVPGEPEGELSFFPAGLLDGDPGCRPGAHMYTGSKAAWFEITDGLQQFEGAPPGYPDPALDAPARPMQAAPDSIAGSCTCGSVAWEQTVAPDRMGHCHCSRCRKLRGAACSAQVFANPDALHWLRGQDDVVQFRLPGAQIFGNSFCGHCGGPVPRELPGAEVFLVPAGALDDDPGLRPQAHIYVASKAPWFEITDDLPQFDALPPG